jgi:nucleoside-diphosphate-sugar epimerase
MEIRGLLALVTGASGFIGGRLAERLATEEGVRVRAMVRSAGKAGRLAKLPLEIVEGDLLDPQSLSRTVKGCDLVFHCAALVRETGKKKEFYQINVQGTENIVKAAVAAGVKKFVHMSSVAVYGLNPPDGADEDTAFQPCGNLYCDTKIAAEKVVWAYHRDKGLPVVVIRPTNVYGPHSKPWTLLPIKMINSGKMMLINGGTGLCNYVYIDNLIDATLLATKRDESVGQAYIITDGVALPWKEFFGCYAQMAGRPQMRSVSEQVGKIAALGMEITSMFTGKPAKITRQAVGFLTKKACFSIEKARRELGYQPRLSLKKGMQITEQWLREEGHLGKTRDQRK